MKNFSFLSFIVLFLTLNVFGEEKYELEVFVDDLDHPWSLVELSSGDLLPVSYTHLTLPTINWV